MKRYLLLVLLLGWTTLAGEIAMARLVAPVWGSGTVVWSFVIAIVLLALALGYWIGGRVADRHPSRRALALWLLPGIILLIAQPLLGKLLLDSVGGFILFVLLGSLAFFFMGAATPWSLRLLEQGPEHAGEIAGKLFAFSTVGSFFGTIGSALIMLPLLGTADTFFLLGAISLLALLLLEVRVAPLLLLPVLLFIFWNPSSSEKNILWEGESAEQHLRVREIEGVRILQLDDGKDIQSVWRPGTKLSGDLWDGPLFLWAAGERQSPGSLLVLGNGAGTTASAWKHFYSQPVLGVELDPKVTELARKYFGLREDNLLGVRHGDARRVLRSESRRWSTIFLDAYDANHIPFQLLTQEFFLELAERLEPDGILLVNLQPRGDLLEVLGSTSRAAFPEGALWRFSRGNIWVLLSKEKLSGEKIEERLSQIPKALWSEAKEASQDIENLPRQGPIWTDDLAPAERYSG